jgi:hypothetical protein
MRLARSVAAALLAGSTAMTFNAPAISAPLTPDSALRSSVAADGVQTVQWRHRHWHRGHGPHWGHRHWRHRHYGWGPAIGGLAAGAIIGGAIASSQAQARSDEVAYCSQRFRSYDPASGTYLGYDGLRHPCP